MGYITRYSINTVPYEPVVELIIANDDDLWPIHEDAEPCKWYQHEEDMVRFSKEYPDTVFELTGEGEDAGDLWRKYFKNGKVQVCDAIITYPPFDESKLE